MPACFRSIKTGVQAYGNAPSLFIPTGGEWTNIPQFIFRSFDNAVAMLVQNLLGSADGCKRQWLTGAAKSLTARARVGSRHRPCQPGLRPRGPGRVGVSPCMTNQ
jgi:hypothetical protein